MFILSSFTIQAVWAAWLRSAVAFNNWVFICSPDTLSRRQRQGTIFDWRLSELRASDKFWFDFSFSRLYNTKHGHRQRWYLTTKMTCLPCSGSLTPLPACLSFLLGRWPVFALIPLSLPSSIRPRVTGGIDERLFKFCCLSRNVNILRPDLDQDIHSLSIEG